MRSGGSSLPTPLYSASSSGAAQSMLSVHRRDHVRGARFDVSSATVGLVPSIERAIASDAREPIRASTTSGSRRQRPNRGRFPHGRRSPSQLEPPRVRRYRLTMPLLSSSDSITCPCCDGASRL